MKRRELLRAIPFLGVLPFFFRVGQQSRWSGTTVERPTLIEEGFKAERKVLHDTNLWYESALREAEAVIKQLDQGPCEVTYIHPYDLSELLKNVDSVEVNFLYRSVSTPDDELMVHGTRYKMSTFMPIRTKVLA